MSYLTKRFKSGLWVSLAGLVATTLTVIVNSIDQYQMTETTKMIVVIVLTAIISQITKWINTAKK